MTGAWFCGVKGWRRYQDWIGNSFLASEACYMGQGFCFALACFSDEKSVDYLCRYLDTYLPQLTNFYEQTWAMPALIWVDQKNGTQFSQKYLEPGGLWEQYAGDHDSRSIEDRKRAFNDTISTAFKYLATN